MGPGIQLSVKVPSSIPRRKGNKQTKIKTKEPTGLAAAFLGLSSPVIRDCLVCWRGAIVPYRPGSAPWGPSWLAMGSSEHLESISAPAQEMRLSSAQDPPPHRRGLFPPSLHRGCSEGAQLSSEAGFHRHLFVWPHRGSSCSRRRPPVPAGARPAGASSRQRTPWSQPLSGTLPPTALDFTFPACCCHLPAVALSWLLTPCAPNTRSSRIQRPMPA